MTNKLCLFVFAYWTDLSQFYSISLIAYPNIDIVSKNKANMISLFT